MFDETKICLPLVVPAILPLLWFAVELPTSTPGIFICFVLDIVVLQRKANNASLSQPSSQADFIGTKSCLKPESNLLSIVVHLYYFSHHGFSISYYYAVLSLEQHHSELHRSLILQLFYSYLLVT